MKYFFYVLLTLFFANTAQAQQIGLSLEEAIQQGIANNYQIKIAQERVAIAENNDDWAIAGRYPTVNLTLGQDNGYNYQNNPASFLRELSSFRFGITPGADLNWTIYNGFRVRYTKEQLEKQVDQATGEQQIAIENTVQQIILAYYQALIQREQLEVLTEVLRLSRDRIAYQEARKEFGQSSSFELLQTQDAYLNDSTTYLIQRTSFENALRNLKLAMGLDDLSREFRLTTPLEYVAQTYAYESLESRMLAQNITIQNLLIARELAQANTQIQESFLKPTVGLRAGANYNYNISSGSGTLGSGETLSLNALAAQSAGMNIALTGTYNIFDGGVRRKNIENAQKQEIITQFQISDTKRALTAQLQNAYANYNNQRELLRITQTLVDNAEQNLAITEERFKGGLINSFDYRTVQLAFINANQARLNALFNLRTTETELMRLVGDLVE